MCVLPVWEGIIPHLHCLVLLKETYRSAVYGHRRYNNWVTSPQNAHTCEEYGTQHLQREREKESSYSYWLSIPLTISLWTSVTTMKLFSLRATSRIQPTLCVRVCVRLLFAVALLDHAHTHTQSHTYTFLKYRSVCVSGPEQYALCVIKSCETPSGGNVFAQLSTPRQFMCTCEWAVCDCALFCHLLLCISWRLCVHGVTVFVWNAHTPQYAGDIQ